MDSREMKRYELDLEELEAVNGAGLVSWMEEEPLPPDVPEQKGTGDAK